MIHLFSLKILLQLVRQGRALPWFNPRLVLPPQLVLHRIRLVLEDRLDRLPPRTDPHPP